MGYVAEKGNVRGGIACGSAIFLDDELAFGKWEEGG
jgi:hypothetical protein